MDHQGFLYPPSVFCSTSWPKVDERPGSLACERPLKPALKISGENKRRLFIEPTCRTGVCRRNPEAERGICFSKRKPSAENPLSSVVRLLLCRFFPRVSAVNWFFLPRHRSSLPAYAERLDSLTNPAGSAGLIFCKSGLRRAYLSSMSL